MRTLTDHVVPGDSVNHQLIIEVMDEPGAGCANHHYRIKGGLPIRNTLDQIMNVTVSAEVKFQNGPIKEAGVNGITHEALLAILLDRMYAFQRGEYSCMENEIALGHLRSALDAMQSRTRKRMARGVEGTHQK